MRIPEYFGETSLYDKCAANMPKALYKQERDWTCSIACIRTLLSAIVDEVPSENFFIDTYGNVPGPRYSKDIKKTGMLDNYDTLFGCDVEQKNFDNIIKLLESGYYIMLESLYNDGHWMVLLAYTAGADVDANMMLVYDPYYDEPRLLHATEFAIMWHDPKHNIVNDFIAIKRAVG